MFVKLASYRHSGETSVGVVIGELIYDVTALRADAPTSMRAFLAWLDTVEAECETICGNTRAALQLIGHAEEALAAGGGHQSPEWFTWFSPVRLAAFKGNTQLKAGHLPRHAKASPARWKPHQRPMTSAGEHPRNA